MHYRPIARDADGTGTGTGGVDPPQSVGALCPHSFHIRVTGRKAISKKQLLASSAAAAGGGGRDLSGSDAESGSDALLSESEDGADPQQRGARRAVPWAPPQMPYAPRALPGAIAAVPALHYNRENAKLAPARMLH